MKILLCLVGLGILLLLYMIKQGFGNNVLTHAISAKGQTQKYSLFLISDAHNRIIHRSVIEKIRGRMDSIIIGGDFADSRTSMEKIEENLKRLSAVAPTYFIWGNNDLEVDQQAFLALFEKYNVKVIHNDSELICTTPNKIRISAIEFNGTTTMIKDSLQKCEADEQLIYVSHDPYRFMKVIQYKKPLLFLAGHLHGGQIRILNWSVFPKGSFQKSFDVYQLISNGYGTTLVPFRLGARAECHIVDIKFKK